MQIGNRLTVGIYLIYPNCSIMGGFGIDVLALRPSVDFALVGITLIPVGQSVHSGVVFLGADCVVFTGVGQGSNFVRSPARGIGPTPHRLTNIVGS